MKPAYILIEEYNNLSEEDKKEFKMVFNRVLDLEERDAKAKRMISFDEMKKIIREDGTPYFHLEFLMKNVLGLTDQEIKENYKPNNSDSTNEFEF
jgi:hypothetical protein